MIDFGVLSAIRKVLATETLGLTDPSDQHIYIMSCPTVPEHWPVILIELEELWGPHRSLANYNAHARLSIKISIFSNTQPGLESLELAKHVSRVLNGHSLAIGDDNEATFKLQSSIFDLKKSKDEPRKVVQYYEVWVHAQKIKQNSDPTTHSS